MAALSPPITSYSLRRFLPTAADVMLVPGDLRDAIGGWSERPSTSHEAAQSSRQPAKHAMAVRYSHHAASTAGAVKRQVIVSLLLTCRNMPEDTALTWDSVRAYAPSWEEVNKLCKQAPSKVEPASHNAVPEKGVGDSSASSSSSSESEDLQRVTLEWFQQRANGQMHLVQRSSQVQRFSI